MSAKKKISFSREDMLILAFAGIIFFLSVRMVSKCCNPFVFNDEAGYWTHAATMAGYDWTGMSQTLAWYSYGYSFLLLPLMKIFHDPVTLYRSALVLNCIMQLAVYFMYIAILRFIFPKLGKAKIGFAAAAAALYTSYQHNTGIGFSETALLFVTVLTAYILVRIINKPTYLNLGLLGAACAYLFMVHNRTIGIAASAALVILLLLAFKKITVPQAVVFFAVMGIGFGADRLIRHAFESRLWVSGKASGNDAGSIFKNIKDAASSAAGMKRMLSVMASQAFASFAATFCISLFALWGLIRRIVQSAAGIIGSARKKEKNSAAAVPEGRIFLFVFIFCAFIATWLISSIFMYNFTRIDHVVYTRYYDITMGMLIMTGICFMECADKTDMYFIFAVPAVLFAGANRACVLMNSVRDNVFSRVCAPSISGYYAKYGTDFYVYAIIAAAAFGILMLLSSVKTRKHSLGIFLAAVAAASAFTIFTRPARVDIHRNQEVYSGDRQLVERVKDIPDAEFRVAPDVGTFFSFVQFMLPDKKVDFAYKPETLGENVYIFANRNDIVNMKDYEYIDSSDRHILYRNRKSSSSQELSLPLSYMYTFDSSFYYADEDLIKSDPSSNYLCFGPYLDLEAGSYSFALNFGSEGSLPENVGYVEVRSGSLGAVYDRVELKGSMADGDGSFGVDLSANIGGKVPDMEIIVFLYEPGAVSMQLNSIKVNTED